MNTLQKIITTGMIGLSALVMTNCSKTESELDFKYTQYEKPIVPNEDYESYQNFIIIQGTIDELRRYKNFDVPQFDLKVPDEKYNKIYLVKCNKRENWKTPDYEETFSKLKNVLNSLSNEDTIKVYGNKRGTMFIFADYIVAKGQKVLMYNLGNDAGYD